MMELERTRVEKRARIARALATSGFDEVFVLDADAAASVLTEKRRELLEYLARNDVRSVRSLADAVDRDKGAVSRDLEILTTHNLVSFEQAGNRKLPKLEHETVVAGPIC